MAVIGSKDSLNRDPAKMQRWYGRAGFGIYERSALQQVEYILSNDKLTAVITTSVVANTPRTIYNVTGKGGSLIWAFGSSSSSFSSMATTFVVTVDGVATTITMGSPTSNYSRAVIGSPAMLYPSGGTMANKQVSPNTYMRSSSSESSSNSGVIDNKAFNYDGSVSNLGTIFLAGLNQPMLNPQACTRFENNLTITVSASSANTDTNYRAAACLVLLDD